MTKEQDIRLAINSSLIAFRSGNYTNDEIVEGAITAMRSMGVFDPPPPKPSEPTPSAIALDDYTRFTISAWGDEDEAGCSLHCRDCSEDVSDDVDECHLDSIISLANDHNKEHHA